MGVPTLDRRSDLGERTAVWVDAGLITAEQRDAIERFEADSIGRSDERITTVTEIAGYLGSIVAIGGGAAIVGPAWADVGLVGQLLIASVIAIVGLVAGGLLVRTHDPAAARLGGFAWLVAIAAIGLAAGVVTHRVDPGDDAWFGVAIGSSVAVAGLALWRNRARPLQLVASAVGLALASGSVLRLMGVPTWGVALAAWVAGLLFAGGVALGWVRPRVTGFVVAAVGTSAAAFQIADRFERAAAVLAIVTAVAIVAVALAERSVALLAVGLVAFVGGTALTLSTLVEGTLARLLAVGVALLVLGAVGLRAQRLHGD